VPKIMPMSGVLDIMRCRAADWSSLSARRFDAHARKDIFLALETKHFDNLKFP